MVKTDFTVAITVHLNIILENGHETCLYKIGIYNEVQLLCY